MLTFAIVSYTGLGRDTWTVPFHDITLTLKYFQILTLFYILAGSFTKVSILLLYLRLFPDQLFRRVSAVGVVVCSFAGFAFFWACLFQCWPVSTTWTFWDGEPQHRGKCSNKWAQGWAHVFYTIVADFAVLFLPLPTIWKLNLALEKKLGIMAMFSVGLL